MAKGKGSNTMARGAKGPAKAAPPATVPAAPAAPPAAAKPKTDPVRFFREVRAEARKITWTSWKETWITSVMVFIMVAVTAVFFLLVDGSLSFLIQQLLRLAG